MPAVPDVPRPDRVAARLLAAALSDLMDDLRTVLPRLVGADPAAVVAQQWVTIVVTAAAPLTPNAYARGRLLRQLHATGLSTADLRRTTLVLDAHAARRPAPVIDAIAG